MRALLVLLLVSGCGTNQLRAVVKTAPCDDPGGKPIADVAVSVQCPDEKPRLIGTTDAHGRLSYERVGKLQGECSILIDKQGFGSRAYEVGDVCILPGRGSCRAVTVSADLVPKK